MEQYGNIQCLTLTATLALVTAQSVWAVGYNGNLYAYLISPTGTLVVLLNQPGSAPFYAPGSGMNITLGSSGN